MGKKKNGPKVGFELFSREIAVTAVKRREIRKRKATKEKWRRKKEKNDIV
jgi:hypothetical protein